MIDARFSAEEFDRVRSDPPASERLSDELAAEVFAAVGATIERTLSGVVEQLRALLWAFTDNHVVKGFDPLLDLG